MNKNHTKSICIDKIVYFFIIIYLFIHLFIFDKVY